MVEFRREINATVWEGVGVGGFKLKWGGAVMRCLKKKIRVCVCASLSLSRGERKRGCRIFHAASGVYIYIQYKRLFCLASAYIMLLPYFSHNASSCVPPLFHVTSSHPILRRSLSLSSPYTAENLPRGQCILTSYHSLCVFCFMSHSWHTTFYSFYFLVIILLLPSH